MNRELINTDILIGLPDDEIIGIVKLYLAEMYILVSELKTAISSADLVRTKQIAHTIKGCSLNVGCNTVAEYAQKIHGTTLLGKMRYYRHMIKRHLELLAANCG